MKRVFEGAFFFAITIIALTRIFVFSSEARRKVASCCIIRDFWERRNDL